MHKFFLPLAILSPSVTGCAIAEDEQRLEDVSRLQCEQDSECNLMQFEEDFGTVEACTEKLSIVNPATTKKCIEANITYSECLVGLECEQEGQERELCAEEIASFERHCDVSADEEGGAVTDAIAWHYTQAEEPQLALPWLVRAGDVAARSLASDRAIRLFRRALDLETLSAERAELFTKLGDAARATGRAEEAADAYLEAISLFSNSTRIRDLERLTKHELLRSGLLARAQPLVERMGKASGVRVPKTMIGVLNRKDALTMAAEDTG